MSKPPTTTETILVKKPTYYRIESRVGEECYRTHLECDHEEAVFAARIVAAHVEYHVARLTGAEPDPHKVTLALQNDTRLMSEDEILLDLSK